MPGISILIADSEQFLRDNFRELIAMQSDMIIIDEARNAEERLVKLKAHHPRILLLDLAIPGRRGQSATELISIASEYSRVIALSLYKDEIYIRESFRAGALGFLVKTDPAERLLRTIRLTSRCERRRYSPWPRRETGSDRRQRFERST